VIWNTKFKPLKIGQIFDHIEIPPSLVNCPKPTSKKKTGTPPRNRQAIYGTKNAPTIVFH